ncbi:MAG: haloalkane dehalogenase [Ignavibacteria bacterium]|nr:MAG: haloalkane dehalogenase [Ignavibacteria bacterium]
MNSHEEISSAFPFSSKYVEVDGQRMHYIDEGEGDPVLFLHGNPTSSYLWRNIIPHVAQHRRCIAPDLIGMGKSDKPKLAYRFADHYPFIEGFVRALDLKNLTLALHDWGSGLGFHYFATHTENVRGIAFMEALVRPASWSAFPKDFRMGFKLMRTPGLGWFMVSVMNVFVKKILPSATVRQLSSEERRIYAAPFPTVGSRKPVRQWPCEIPIDGEPGDMHRLISEYSKKLQESTVPKMLFYAHPGGIINAETVAWCKEVLPNLKAVDIGNGIHYLQEDNPHLIGRELATWIAELD